MLRPLAAVALRNRILALRPELEVSLKNVRVNGALFGCSGFVRDPNTGRIVYVDTDHNHYTNTRALYRTATSTSDYTGGTNRFAVYEDLPGAVSDLLG